MAAGLWYIYVIFHTAEFFHQSLSEVNKAISIIIVFFILVPKFSSSALESTKFLTKW